MTGHPARHSRALRAIGTVGVLMVVAAWFVWLRPAALGGATGFVIVSGTSMEPTMRSGDLAVVRRTGEPRIGDVLAFRIPDGDPGEGHVVIHRIIGGDARTGWLLRGDNKQALDLWRPTPQDVVGTMRLHLPGAFFTTVFSPAGTAALVGVTVFLIFLGPSGRRRSGEVASA